MHYLLANLYKKGYRKLGFAVAFFVFKAQKGKNLDLVTFYAVF